LNSTGFFKKVETLVNSELSFDFRKLRRNTEFDQKKMPDGIFITQPPSHPELKNLTQTWRSNRVISPYDTNLNSLRDTAGQQAFSTNP
jgi:hypothetical protein